MTEHPLERLDAPERLATRRSLTQKFWSDGFTQGAVLFLLILAVFWRVSSCQFLNYDDPEYVYANPHVRTGLSGENFAWAFCSLNAGVSYWHPLTWISHQLDCQLFGLQPGAHHLTNVWLHFLNALLVLKVLRQLGFGHKSSFLMAALFAVHPLQVESVAWIAERKNVLFALFWLASLSCYVEYRQSARRQTYWAAVLCFGLALLSKPAAVTLPAVLLLLEWMRLMPAHSRAIQTGNRDESGCYVRWRQDMMLLAPFVVLSLTIATITIVAQANLSALPDLQRWPASARLDNALVSYVAYLKSVLFPTGLCVSYVQAEPYSMALVFLSGSVLCLISIVAVAVRRSRPWILTGWLWFLATLVPNIGLVQAGAQSMADRYMYIPIVGVLLVAAGLVQGTVSTPRRRWIAGSTGTALIMACSVLSSRLLYSWVDSVSLFSRAVAHNQNNWVAQLGLGMAFAGERRFDESLPHLLRALDLPGNSSEAHKGLGIVYQGKREFHKSLEHYENALRLNPHSAEIHLLLAELLATSQEEAIRDLVRAVRLVERGLELRQSVGALD